MQFHPGSQIRRPQSGYARHPDPYASGYGPPPQAVIMQRMARSQQAQPSGPIPIPGQALSQPNPEAMAMLPLYPAPNMPPYGPPNGYIIPFLLTFFCFFVTLIFLFGDCRLQTCLR